MTTETKTIGAAELQDLLAEYTETPRARVHRILDCMATLAVEALSNGQRVRIPGIGILAPVPTPPRSGTGPDGRLYSKPGSVRVRLRPDASLKRLVAQGIE